MTPAPLTSRDNRVQAPAPRRLGNVGKRRGETEAECPVEHRLIKHQVLSAAQARWRTYANEWTPASALNPWNIGRQPGGYAGSRAGAVRIRREYCVMRSTETAHRLVARAIDTTCPS